MATTDSSNSIQPEQALQLPEQRRTSVLSFSVGQRIIALAVLALAVQFITPWQYTRNHEHAVQGDAHPGELRLPKGVVFVDRKGIAVHDSSTPTRNHAQPFTAGHAFSTDEPLFQLYDPEFLEILGDAPAVRRVSDVRDSKFAHEGPVWIKATDEVVFCSYGGLPPTGPNKTNVLSKINMKDVEAMDWHNPKATVTITEFAPSPTVEMTNGGTWYDGKVLLVNSGRGEALAPNLVLVEPTPPYNSTVILDNFHGLQFNSLNDAAVHPVSKAIFATDPTYGYAGGFRPKPKLPAQIYRFDARTGEIRVVADSFEKPNGIKFAPDGRTVYIADSGALYEGGYDPTRPATIYAFDVDPDPRSQAFMNRRVFAYIDTIIPDGLVLDTKGNVYVSTGEGVAVFSPHGTLLGKIFIGSVSANLAFASNGQLVILAENQVYVAKLAAEGMDLDYW